jgi:hypothetical protein
MAKTDEYELCQQFVTTHLSTITFQSEQCTTELNIQFQSCPTTLLPLRTTLDQNLKEFVQIQQKHLLNKMNFQLARYKDMIHEKELFQTLSTFNRTDDQVISFLFAFLNLIFFFSFSLHIATYPR